MPLTVQKLIRRLTLRQLQVFQAVYQQQGYGRAADLLGLTQPAVSAQIKQLEQALGLKLFEIVGRKVYCTAAGEMVADSVAIIFEQLRVLQNDIHALEGQISGDLRIAAVNTAQYVVPYLLKPFRERYPEVNISLHVVNRAKAIQRLNENKDDLVVMGIVPTERPLTSIPFLDNELVPVVAPEHTLAKQQASQERVTLADFLAADVLVREPGSGSRLALEQHCHQVRHTLLPAMEIGSNDALKHAVIAGLGVAVLPRLGILPELRTGALTVLDIEGFPLRRSWCLVYPSGKSPSPASQRFIDYVQSHLKEIKNSFSERQQMG